MSQAMPDFRPLEGKYEILRKLGAGGMGDIYLVRHKLLEELRVVKVMQPQLREATDFRERFLREARTAIQLRHPNLAQLHDFSVDDDGTAFMILEFIEGCTVEDLIGRPQFSSLRLQVEIAQQALRAVGFLHRRGFVHRDISPDNLMLSQDADGHPLVKLLDLGIVKPLDSAEKLTGTATFLGKYMYASPEQLEAKEIDARSDIYSMGVVLYQMFTGHYPIKGADIRSILVGHLFEPPLSFDSSDKNGRLPAELRRTILAALEKKPTNRIQTAEEFASRLAAVDLPTEPGGPMLSGKALASFLSQSVPKRAQVHSAQRKIDEHFQEGDRTPVVSPTLLERDDLDENRKPEVRHPRAVEERELGRKDFDAEAERAQDKDRASKSAALVEEARKLCEGGDLDRALAKLKEAEGLGPFSAAGRDLATLVLQQQEARATEALAAAALEEANREAEGRTASAREAAAREAAAREIAAREDAARVAAAREAAELAALDRERAAREAARESADRDAAAREAAARNLALRESAAREAASREAAVRAAAAREAASREAEARSVAAREATERKAAADEAAVREAALREAEARENKVREAEAHLDSRVEALEQLLAKGEFRAIRKDLRRVQASSEAKLAGGSTASIRLSAFAARFEEAAAAQARAETRRPARLIAVCAAVALALVGVWWGISKSAEAPSASEERRAVESTATDVPNPMAKKEAPPVAPASTTTATGFLRITSEPWAFVESVRVLGGAGGFVPIEKGQSSPLGLALPPGTYEVTLRDRMSGKVVVRRAEIAIGKSARVHERFAPVDVDAYFAQEAGEK